MTENEQQPDPEDAPVEPLTAEEQEPDVKPFAGDDDILAGHLDES